MSGTTTEPQEEITGGSGGFRCHGACVTRTGQEGDAKKINQDSCFAFERYLTDDQSLFGAFDGHGPCGHLVSGFVKKQLPASLAQLSGSIPEPRQLLMETYAQVDRALNSSQVDCEFSGTTAVVMYAKGSQVRRGQTTVRAQGGTRVPRCLCFRARRATHGRSRRGSPHLITLAMVARPLLPSLRCPLGPAR